MNVSKWIFLVLLGAAGVARADTFRVGPGESIRELTALPRLSPGDVVEVLGGATYSGGIVLDDVGSEAMPIVVRGVPDASGARPVIRGGTNTIEVRGDHYVLENLDVTAGSFRCVFHHAHDVTIRDSVVHDCPAHGILGADEDSGSLTLERVEVHHCGNGTQEHQIYMATDESTHPGSVFRMQGCWIHDGNGGNNVKSRAERNEILASWFEGASYHELELIGPEGEVESRAREDSDVVGNVFVKSGSNAAFFVFRFGGDGTAQTNGRYRVVANTVVVSSGSSAVFRLFDGLESVEMHGNVFVRRGGGNVTLIRDAEASWVGGRTIAGTNNWVPSGTTVPSEWRDTLVGADPGFVDLATLDLTPASASSAVVDAAIDPPTFAAAPFPSPMPWPSRSPRRAAGDVARARVGAPDVGAFEWGTAPPGTDAGTDLDAGVSGVDGGSSHEDGGVVLDSDASIPFDTDASLVGRDAGPRSDAGARTDAGTSDGGMTGGCTCRVSSPSVASGGVLTWGCVALALRRRRRDV